MIIINGNPAFGTNTNVQSGQQPIPKWEYIEVQYDWWDNINPTYDMLGLLGWEQVTVLVNPNKDELALRFHQCRAVFKRPL